MENEVRLISYTLLMDFDSACFLFKHSILFFCRNQQTFPKDLCCGQPCDIDSDSLSSSVEEHPDLSPKEMLTDDECSDCLVNDADGEEIISDVEITSNSEPDFDEDEREFD